MTRQVAAVVIFALVTALNAELDEWWRTAVFYQTYPRSFKDSNNDGSGDLKGITSKLQYLKDSGIDATWLSPIFDSPLVDAGYDISNFRKVNPLFGTNEDFTALLQEANRVGLKIILDFVPNHSSDKHEWFEKSVNREPGYEDYYVWRDCERTGNTTIPPNNWISIFTGSAWEWNEQRQQCYLHQFAVQQPDLNYRSVGLVNEMKSTLRFWLDQGVAGFRVDAIPFLFEDASFLDEPKNEDTTAQEGEYNYYLHVYTMDQNETYDMVVQFREVLDEYAARDNVSRVMMVEAYTNVANTMKYFGNATHNGATFPFNFFLLNDLTNESNAYDYQKAIYKWLDNVPDGRPNNWVLGNHDNHRTATRLGRDKADIANILLASLPGASVTYNGEEIGMEDGYVSWNETQDPSALALGPDHYLDVSRDPERTPFQWDDSTNAGFNEGAPTWLPVSDKYLKTNLAAQDVDGLPSHYNVYKYCTFELKEDEILKYGNTSVQVIDEKQFVIIRQLDYRFALIIFNLDDSKQLINLKGKAENLPEHLHFKYSTKRNIVAKTKLLTSKIPIGPSEVLVLHG